MSAVLIDGKETARIIRAELKEKAAALTAAGMRPGLTVILVGDDPASCSYVTGKKAACEELGIFSDSLHLPADFPEAELLKIIDEKNRDSRIHGILVQLPLPPHIDENKIIGAISPEKDVDGFHPVNVGRMVLEQECFLPCTPHGILQLLMRSNIDTKGYRRQADCQFAFSKTGLRKRNRHCLPHRYARFGSRDQRSGYSDCRRRTARNRYLRYDQTGSCCHRCRSQPHSGRLQKERFSTGRRCRFRNSKRESVLHYACSGRRRSDDDYHADGKHDYRR